jgi:hypothetical protein
MQSESPHRFLSRSSGLREQESSKVLSAMRSAVEAVSSRPAITALSDGREIRCASDQSVTIFSKTGPTSSKSRESAKCEKQSRALRSMIFKSVSTETLAKYQKNWLKQCGAIPTPVRKCSDRCRLELLPRECRIHGCLDLFKASVRNRGVHVGRR